MPAASIHQIAVEDRLPKSDRLFRAAISGYCSLTRATRRDAAQLDDLALPLLPLVTEESKRFAAAALSESHPAPAGLLRRLADHPVAVSAPLLVRSRALADVDLIGLIGRNGVAHARAIARRPALNPNIAALVRALGVVPEPEMPAAPMEPALASPAEAGPAPSDTSLVQNSPAEEAREQLRAMMLPAEKTAPAAHARAHRTIDWAAAHAAYPRMVSTGLTGVEALFQTAVADAFGLSFKRACEIVGDPESLSVALKAAAFPAAEAFFLAALAFPPRFGSTAAIRSFVEDYRRLDLEESRRLVASWQDEATPAPSLADTPPSPANADEQAPDWAGLLLKAS